MNSPIKTSLDDFDKTILIQYSHGNGMKQVARNLNMSTHGIEDRLKRIRRILYARNTLHAVTEALRKGLIT